MSAQDNGGPAFPVATATAVHQSDLRAAADAVMAHQWSNSRKAMDALTRLVDAAVADPWRAAVDDMLTVAQMVASDDPRESLNRLIDWHCAVAVDPAVSSAAAALVERGRREAPAVAPLTDEQIDDQPWCGSIPFEAGLREFARAIERAHGIGGGK